MPQERRPPLLLAVARGIVLLLLCAHGAVGYGWTALEWGWGERSADMLHGMNGTYAVLQDKLSSLASLGVASLRSSQGRASNETASPPSQTIITFVNGIYHSEEDWERLAEQLSATFQKEVRPFYNPTTGWWVADATRAGYSLVVRPDDDAVALGLTEHLRSALQDAGPMGRVLHLAHSGGALLTYLAAKHHLEPGEMERIDVATFGGARSITRKYFRGRAVNYYAKNDPVVFVDRRAASLLRSGGAGGDVMEVLYTKHNTSFVFIEGRARNSLRDHSLEGPTYQEALRLEAKAFFERERKGLQITEQQPRGWFAEEIRAARKRVAQFTGLHGYFSGKGHPPSSSWAISELIPAPSAFLMSGSLPANWKSWARKKAMKWRKAQSSDVALPLHAPITTAPLPGASVSRSNETGRIYAEEAQPGSRWVNIGQLLGVPRASGNATEPELERPALASNITDVIAAEPAGAFVAQEDAAINASTTAPLRPAEEQWGGWSSKLGGMLNFPWTTHNATSSLEDGHHSQEAVLEQQQQQQQQLQQLQEEEEQQQLQKAQLQQLDIAYVEDPSSNDEDTVQDSWFTPFSRAVANFTVKFTSSSAESSEATLPVGHAQLSDTTNSTAAHNSEEELQQEQLADQGAQDLVEDDDTGDVQAEEGWEESADSAPVAEVLQVTPDLTTPPLSGQDPLTKSAANFTDDVEKERKEASGD
jgi:hypothetical protein